MDITSPCVANTPSFNSLDTQTFFSYRAEGGRKEMEPVMIKLRDLASPSKKNEVLALTSMGGKCKVWEFKTPEAFITICRYHYRIGIALPLQ